MNETPVLPPELMNGDFQDFIGVWENFLPKSFCVEVINVIETWILHALNDPAFDDTTMQVVRENIDTGSNQFENSNLGRKDKAVFLSSVDKQISTEINQYLAACLQDYKKQYGQLAKIPLTSVDIKAQKTESGGGYHVWHYESSHPDSVMRELVWAIYLNDIDDGEGETEFLYQKRRIKPTTGTVTIWPAGMTHVHRGNPVYTKPKYILTGWFLKRPA